jgi:hypothetical protein
MLRSPPSASFGAANVILSGYPQAAEVDLFARHVLSRLEHGSLLRFTHNPH